MTEGWMESLLEFNLISLSLILIMLISILQGMLRGASRSAGRLFALLGGGILTVVAIAATIPLTIWISPKVQIWLGEIVLPQRELAAWERVFFMLISAVRDFPLMRFAVLFIIGYWIVRSLLGLISLLVRGGGFLRGWFRDKERSASPLSRLTGAGIGGLIGVGRCLMVIAVLFIIVTLFPTSSFSRYVVSSPVYQQGAQSVIEPLTGQLIKEKLPVFTRSVEAELNGILQQRYEVIDADVPQDIELAAAQITKDAANDEEKARRLYEWIGSRVQYDYDKVKDYEDKGIWHEQTPQMTFDTKLGVCIDYSRLYAVMARSQGLDVKVVTGLGYDGKGGYGPHAWNEVYLSELQKWVPLDATWAGSGDWFNPPGFSETHVPDQLI